MSNNPQIEISISEDEENLHQFSLSNLDNKSPLNILRKNIPENNENFKNKIDQLNAEISYLESDLKIIKKENE